MNRYSRYLPIAVLAVAMVFATGLTSVSAGPDAGAPAPMATLIPVPRPTAEPDTNPLVRVDRVWTTDASGFPKSTFYRGETIRFVARLLNRSRSTQRVLTEFLAAEPGWFPLCELSCPPPHRLFRGYINVPPGLWSYAISRRSGSRDPLGVWTFIANASTASGSSGRQVSFRLR